MSRLTVGGLFCAAWLLIAASTAAQDAAAPAKPEAAKPEAVKPEPAKPAPKPRRVADNPDEEVVTKTAPLLSPAVEAVLSSQPTTPGELVQAAQTLAGLGHAELAKPMLTQVLAAQPGPEALLSLWERFGSAALLELTRNEALLPEARQLADAVLAAAAAAAQDAKQIDAWIEQLGDASPLVREHARQAIVHSAPAAAPRLVAALGDAGRAAEHPTIRRVLVELGVYAQWPLLAALESGDAALTQQALLVLGQIRVPGIAAFLLEPLYLGPPDVCQAAETALRQLSGSVPDRLLAAHMAAEAARDYFLGRQSPVRVVAGRERLWQWDPAEKQVVLRDLSAEEASRWAARRLARAAYALDPSAPAIRRLLAATLLDAAAHEAGLDQPLEPAAAAEAEGLGLEVIEGVLRDALEQPFAPAAAAAARILGRQGSAGANIYRPDNPAPLVQAARHVDRRARLAAVEAIVALQPAQPYPGDSFVVEALQFFAATRGARRVLAAAPKTGAALDLAARLMPDGYEVETATSGRELVRKALECPDYELVLIDLYLGEPAADFVVQHLRRDHRTADLPVLLLAHAEQFPWAQSLARRNRLTLAFPRAHDDQAFQAQMAQVGRMTGEMAVPFDVRQKQAAAALQLLGALAQGPDFYPLARAQASVLTALNLSPLASLAMPLAAGFGTAQSQRALLELADRNTAPVELRQAAAEALQANIQKHGILLTKDEILRQYERYNHTAKTDEGVRAVLGRVLDSLEAPSQPRPAPEAPKP